LDRLDQEKAALGGDDAPPTFEMERIIANEVDAGSTTLMISIKGLKTNGRGNTNNEEFLPHDFQAEV
jgi:hypothetical protein